jgi:hypothetical protein
MKFRSGSSVSFYSFGNLDAIAVCTLISGQTGLRTLKWKKEHGFSKKK